MKISKLNESIMEVVNKYSTLNEADEDDKEEKVVFSIYYFDENNERNDFRPMKSFNSLKKFLNNLMSDPSKLDSLGATGLFVDDSDDRNVFSAFKGDGGKWVVEEDNLDDFQKNIYLDPEYRDTLLNRVVYSLTSTLPPNLSYNSPSLAKSLFKIPPSTKMAYDDIFGYDFLDNGDAIINLTLKKDDGKTIQKKKESIKKVCDHFGVELRPFGERAFSIVVPNQAKYYNEY